MEKRKIVKPSVETNSLSQFFPEDTNFIVPRYQRNYAWTPEEVEQLMVDLYDFSESSDPYYLLGQVILAESDKSDYTYELIDGQQRTSTLMVLFSVIHRKLKDIGSSATKGVHTAYKNGEDGDLDSRIRVLMSGDASKTVLEYSNGVDVKNLSADTNSQKRIIDAIKTVETFLSKKGISKDVDKLREFSKNILGSVYMSALVIPDPDQANDFFERVNTRGLGLNSSDNLKNRLLQKISDRGYEDASNLWTEAEQELFKTGNAKEGSMQSLLSHLYRAKVGRGVNHSELYKAWKDFTGSEDECWDLMASIRDKSGPLARIIADAGNNSDGTRHMKFVQNYPVRLAGSHLSTSSYKLLEKRVEAIAMLWLLAEKGANRYDTIASKWAIDVAQLGVDATMQEIIEATSIEVSFVDLERISRERIADLRYGKTDGSTKRIRYILARVAYELNLVGADQNFTVADFLTTTKTDGRSKKTTPGFDIEHISPKSLNEFEDMTDSLGNLTLLHHDDNKVAGTNTPRGKANKYQGSLCFATRALSETPQANDRIENSISIYRVAVVDGTEDWNTDMVDARAKMYQHVLFNALQKDLGE
jgi:hypothetical protein